MYKDLVTPNTVLSLMHGSEQETHWQTGQLCGLWQREAPVGVVSLTMLTLPSTQGQLPTPSPVHAQMLVMVCTVTQDNVHF